MSHLRLSIAALLLLTLLPKSICRAGDWPQILGPQRNGIAADDEQLAPRWPRTGPPVVWERSVGSGYAGVAVVGERGVIFHRIGDDEIIEGFNVLTGKPAFRDASPTSFTPQVGGGDGPLCVPVIQAGKIVAFGAQGRLTCLDLKSGRRLWQRDTHRDFGATEGYFGAGGTPIVVGEAVIANVGGSRAGAGIVAFSLASGQTLWKQTDEPASYSAPIAVRIHDMTLVLMVTRYKCLLIDPQAGTILFQFPFGQRGPTVNGASPVVMGDRLLVTASYGIGSVYAEFDLLGCNILFQGERPLATQYCTPIFWKGSLYAIDGRDDVPPADLKCLDLSLLAPKTTDPGQPQSLLAPKTTSPVKWIEQGFGYGTLLLADGKLLAQKTNGELLLIQPDSEGLKVISQARPFRNTVRALPAVSNGRLYLRNDDTLKCLNVGRGL